MDATTAARLIAKLQAAFPQVDFTGSTGGVYAEVLMDIDTTDAEAGIRSLIETETWPSVAALVQHCDEAYKRALYDARYPMLASADEVVFEAPEEVKAILHDYFERFGRPDNGPERGRRIAREQIAAETGKGGAELSPRMDRDPSPFPQRSACGAEWGTRAVLIDGVKCCPACRSPISEGCTVKRAEVSA